ncbi:hypothetical protein HHK36_027045 [Tetracentron sinense]|uniref:Uncharacterized protein n=1 Tax=Tetracentron sinense TaxID=13715 RepID=A0A834YG59_TETSI|nr:hypothetical protein HHK36_027045 [Tetracentron sinense]
MATAGVVVDGEASGNGEGIVGEANGNGESFHRRRNLRQWGSQPVNVYERDADWRQRETELLQERGDGWLENEMGEFFNDQGDDGEVEMSLEGMEGYSC